MKTILISIPTRDRPDLLEKSINEILNQCNNPNQIGIYVLHDSDQTELYSNVVSKYADKIFVDSIPRIKRNGVRHLYLRSFEYFLSHEYYFLWQLADDVSNYSKGWDDIIAEKIHYFKDDLFCLCTEHETHGRNNEVKINCYSIPFKRPPKKRWKGDKVPIQPTDWAMYHGLGELFPIYSYKWVYYLDMFYKNNPGCLGGNDIVTAAMIQSLCMNYKEKRNVIVPIQNMECINHNTNHHLMSEDKKPFTLKEINKVTKHMYNYLLEHK